jgi:glutathione peroxidase
MLRWISSLFAAQIAVTSAADLTAIPFRTIEGKDTSLADFRGKVVLLVNTASKCGLTGQYAGLEKIYDRFKDQGFVVLGFPCNDFMGQEPGTHDEIVEFCTTRYDVSFPLMEKIHVKGKDQHPLYAALTGPDGAFPGAVKWNFGKFLIGRDGTPKVRFSPRQKPESPAIVEAIEKALDEEP